MICSTAITSSSSRVVRNSSVVLLSAVDVVYSMFPVSFDLSWFLKIAVDVVVALQMTLPPGYISGVIHEMLEK